MNSENHVFLFLDVMLKGKDKNKFRNIVILACYLHLGSQTFGCHLMVVHSLLLFCSGVLRMRGKQAQCCFSKQC